MVAQCDNYGIIPLMLPKLGFIAGAVYGKYDIMHLCLHVGSCFCSMVAQWCSYEIIPLVAPQSDLLL